MFSEALTHPLYTLNCTVLPPAFCDGLFNSEVQIPGVPDLTSLAGVSDLSEISYSDLPDASDLPDLSSLSMSDLPSGKQFYFCAQIRWIWKAQFKFLFTK
ncbi:hypothetical protein TNCV_4720131 [Trichonephila clavipes]|uniref:Uncharacterized protein n=1 Tax=Trichonephila clavipes TaxID=2585209 RepID=A0A8X6W6R9_TRICX|nr:hypothetical protein TNCV_4720131 [Trichonephila clavipes]